MVAGLLTTACDNSGSTNTTAPTTVAAASIVEPPFTGTLQVGGTNTHTFTVNQIGSLTVTLTAAGPPATIFVGLGVGTFSSGTCSLAATASAQGGTAAQLSGTASIVGMWCVQVGDIGNLAAPVTYSITVVHS